jgi:plasmid stabilization system protein ParE
VALIDMGNTLADFPNRGRPVGARGVMEIVAVFPYVIRYRIAGAVVRILRVRHAARRPTRP